MKLFSILFLLLSILSCNSKYNENSDSDDMYNILSQEFGSDMEYLQNEVQHKLKMLSQDSINYQKALSFDKLIIEYSDYLFELELELLESNTNPFIANDTISKLATEYLNNNKLYRESLSELIQDEDLKQYLNNKLRTNSPQNRNGEIINHMTYYFYDISRSGTLAYLRNKRRNLFLIETSYLTKLTTSN